MTPDEHAAALLAAYDHAGRLPLRSTEAGFDLARGYEVAEALRQRRMFRGEQQCGYKIGFTNRTIWSRYDVHGPIWGPVWNTTTQQLPGSEADVSLAGLVQPRLEPEIVFGFAKAPRAGMTEAQLADCLEWVAHGFEIVHTHYDDWRFQAADTVADFALHGRLIIGPRVPMSRFSSPGADLAALKVQLLRGDEVVDQGAGSNVLDGPLNALRLWLDAMLAQEHGWAVLPGYVVTTGTITDAAPLLPGQRWSTRLSDTRLANLTLRTRA